MDGNRAKKNELKDVPSAIKDFLAIELPEGWTALYDAPEEDVYCVIYVYAGDGEPSLADTISVEYYADWKERPFQVCGGMVTRGDMIEKDEALENVIMSFPVAEHSARRRRFLGLTEIPTVGRKTVDTLMERYHSISKLARADVGEISSLPQIDERTAYRIQSQAKLETGEIDVDEYNRRYWEDYTIPDILRPPEEDNPDVKGWPHARQKKLAQKPGEHEQTMFMGTRPLHNATWREKRKQRPRETRQQPLEKHGVDIQDPGQPKLGRYTPDHWSRYIDNLRDNDIGFLHRMPTEKITRDDMTRIWTDIKTHEDIILSLADILGERARALEDIRDIKRDFHRFMGRSGVPVIYTDWDSHEIARYYTGSGIEYPFDITGDVTEKGYTTGPLEIRVDCGGTPRDRCARDVSQIIRCERRGGNHNRVRLSCEVEGRKVPVDFLLTGEGI